jgi:3-deoxy-D-manno-octulosonic-acid transferase
MPRLIYSLLVCALLPWAVLHLLWRARRQPAYLHYWKERFGIFTAVAPGPTIWIHAVSVGETRAAQPIVAALREKFPAHRIVFTHMTPTGRETSVALFGDTVGRVYLPYDTPWAVARFLRWLQPEFGLIMETELWPNLIAACRKHDIPMHLVNARLSERSARRYARFPRLTAEALAALSTVCAQSPADAERLRQLGATDVTVTGNVKFDIDVPAAQLALGQQLRARCGERQCWLAASTREGEEKLILDAWRKVGSDRRESPSRDGSTVLLIIVPRHPQRFDEVAQLATAMGFAVQRRAENADVLPTTEVLIGDSMGEMFAYYAMADLAFVGGSLLDYGSQNLIEPCAVGTPVLVGPSTRNFAEAAAGATACGAALAIQDAEMLVSTALRLLAAPAELQRMGTAGREFAARHRGATARTLALITPAAR